MRPKATPNDRSLALGVTLAGGLLLFVALRARWDPGVMNPGIEGCLTAGVVGTLLALLRPMAFRHAMAISAPVIGIEYVACAYAGGPAVAVVALHLILAGFVGLVMAMREPRPEGDRQPRSEGVRQGAAPRETAAQAG